MQALKNPISENEPIQIGSDATAIFDRLLSNPIEYASRESLGASISEEEDEFEDEDEYDEDEDEEEEDVEDEE